MRVLTCVFAFLAATAVTPLALAEALPTHTSPVANATVTAPPHDVKMWFDGKIDSIFSTIEVKDAAGKRVSIGNGKVSGKDRTLLETTFPANLPAGKYEVYWSIIGDAGLPAKGHYAFTLK